MKKILRLDEDDITGILMEHFDVRPSQVTSLYTDIKDEETDEIETRFFVEIEQGD